MSIKLFDGGYKTIKAKYEEDSVWKLTINSIESKYSFWMNEEQIKELINGLLNITGLDK